MHKRKINCRHKWKLSGNGERQTERSVLFSLAILNPLIRINAQKKNQLQAKNGSTKKEKRRAILIQNSKRSPKALTHIIDLILLVNQV